MMCIATNIKIQTQNRCAVMWSSNRPPDILEGTRPLCAIEKAFGIDIDEDLAVEFYDMNLDEAAKKIVELQEE